MSTDVLVPRFKLTFSANSPPASRGSVPTTREYGSLDQVIDSHCMLTSAALCHFFYIIKCESDVVLHYGPDPAARFVPITTPVTGGYCCQLSSSLLSRYLTTAFALQENTPSAAPSFRNETCPRPPIPKL